MIKEFFQVKSISKQIKIVGSRIRIFCLAMPQNSSMMPLFSSSLMSRIHGFSQLGEPIRNKSKNRLTPDEIEMAIQQLNKRIRGLQISNVVLSVVIVISILTGLAYVGDSTVQDKGKKWVNNFMDKSVKNILKILGISFVVILILLLVSSLPPVQALFENMISRIGMSLKEFLALGFFDSRSITNDKSPYLQELEKEFLKMNRNRTRELLWYNGAILSTVLGGLWIYLKYLMPNNSHYFDIIDLILKLEPDKKEIFKNFPSVVSVN